MKCILCPARIVEFGGLHPTAVSQAHRRANPAGFEKAYITKEDVENAHVHSMIAYNNCRTNFPVAVRRGDLPVRRYLGRNRGCRGIGPAEPDRRLLQPWENITLRLHCQRV